MTITKVLLSVAILPLLAGCGGNDVNKESTLSTLSDSTGEAVTYEVSTIALSDTSDYNVDFANAIQMGDFRFVGVYGYALEIPGIPDFYERFGDQYDVKVIEGTSDHFTFEDTAALRLDVLAREYALGYNRLMLEHLGADRN